MVRTGRSVRIWKGREKKIAVLTAAIGNANPGCATDADVVSENISKLPVNSRSTRKIIFINGFTDKYLLSIEGFLQHWR